MKEKQDVDIWGYSFMLNMRWNSFSTDENISRQNEILCR